MTKRYMIELQVLSSRGRANKGAIVIRTTIPIKHTTIRPLGVLLVQEFVVEASGWSRCAHEDTWLTGYGIQLATERVLEDVRKQLDARDLGWIYQFTRSALVQDIRERAFDVTGKYFENIG